MGNVEQTKGYWGVRGIIMGLDGKSPYESQYKSEIGFRIKTSKENQIFVSAGGWLTSKLNVKVKGEGMTEVVDLPENTIAEELSAFFKDGDSVFASFAVEPSSYNGENKFKYKLTRIYIADKEIDFDSPNFEEFNELNTAAIISSKLDLDREKINAIFVPYYGKNKQPELVEMELTVDDEDVRNYLNENAAIGDVFPLTINVQNKLIYEEVKDDKKEETKVRTSLKGKKTGGNKGGNRKIVGSESILTIVDIDIEEIKKGVYTESDLCMDADTSEMPF